MPPKRSRVMYLADDPRSKLQSPGAAGAPKQQTATSGARFAGRRVRAVREHALLSIGCRWRRPGLRAAKIFIVAYTQASPGARLERTGQIDEYMLLIPQRDFPVSIEAGVEVSRGPRLRTHHRAARPKRSHRPCLQAH